MRHRIARLFEPLLRFLRRPGRDSCRCNTAYAETPLVNGPTVHHAGSRPPQATPPVAVLGMGFGSYGLPAAAFVKVTR